MSRSRTVSPQNAKRRKQVRMSRKRIVRKYVAHCLTNPPEAPTPFDISKWVEDNPDRAMQLMRYGIRKWKENSVYGSFDNPQYAPYIPEGVTP